ncbi:M23 family metallopeptidase, partial [Pseudomonas aeruginosa]
MHDGLDFSTSGASQPLYATTDGKITFIGNRRSAGNAILIERSNGDVVAYYHMSGFATGLK